MSEKNGGPAFPLATGWVEDHQDGRPKTVVLVQELDHGMTLRAYAAIKLKVPDSGIDWLDEMIKKSLSADFAVNAMQEARWMYGDKKHNLACAQMTYEIADAMLKAKEA